MIGAGEGNRTLVISLEGWMILNNIRDIAAKQKETAPIGVNGLRPVCKTPGGYAKRNRSVRREPVARTAHPDYCLVLLTLRRARAMRRCQ
jgi:hypothetical protein